MGELTLDDPISFSGTICFTDGMTDAAAFFGYFNRDNQVAEFDKARSDAFSPVANTMGITIADSSAVGYYFLPQVTSAGREVVRKTCEVFTPDRRRQRFAFDYDPEGNGGTGRVTVTLDGHSVRARPARPSSGRRRRRSTASGWRTSAAAAIRSSSTWTT